MAEKHLFKGSELYCKMLESFSDRKKIKVNLKSNDISKAIFLDLARMKHADWRMKIEFNRHKRHTISEIFQDIIAFYLNICLPDKYEIELEKKIKRTQTDIAIKKNGKYIFLIEIKTTIGWDRPDQTSVDPFQKVNDRINLLSENFGVSKKNIIYIFEDHGNVNKKFSAQFWNKKDKIPKAPPNEFPYSIIRPLFNGNDPYYWKYEKGFNRQTQFKLFNEKEILSRAECNIVTPFESIIAQILKAK